MASDDEDTQAFRVADLRSSEPAGRGPAPPPGPPPNAWVEDLWPWLALLGLLALAGLLVWLFVFHGRHHAQPVVPAVVGLRQQEAIGRLQRHGYSVRAILGPARRPRGVVAAQSPGAGSRLPKGETVTLRVSNGRAPAVVGTATTTTAATTTTTEATTTVAAPTAQVPDVSSSDLPTAEGLVEAAGFVTEAEPVSGAGPAGSVQGQSPPAGSSAPAGSVVTIQVVRGPGSAQVPNVVGRSASEARAALAQARLTFKTVYRSGKAGIVLAQAPTGTQPAYTQVVITVGQ